MKQKHIGHDFDAFFYYYLLLFRGKDFTNWIMDHRKEVAI